MELQTTTVRLRRISQELPARVSKKASLGKLKELMKSEGISLVNGEYPIVRVKAESSLDIRRASILPGVDSGIIRLTYVEKPERKEDGTLSMDRYFELQETSSPNRYAYSKEEIVAKLAYIAMYLDEIKPLEDLVAKLKLQLGPASISEEAAKPAKDRNVIKSNPMEPVYGCAGMGCRPRPKTLEQVLGIA